MASVATQPSSSQSSNQLSNISSEISHYASDLKSQLQSWVPEKMNVSETERTVSGVVGTALGVLAAERFFKGSFLTGGLALAGGAMLLFRGISGKCPAYKAMDVDTATEDEASTKAGFSTFASPKSSSQKAPMENRSASTPTQSPAQAQGQKRDSSRRI